MVERKDIKILFIGSGPAMPSRNPAFCGRFEELGKFFPGDIVTHAAPEELDLGNIGNFNFIPFRYKKWNPVLRLIRFYFIVFKKAIPIIRRNRPSQTVIITPDPLGTGLCAIILAKITGAKVIAEVNGCFDQVHTTYVRKGKPASFTTRVKKKLTRFIVPFVLKRVDKIKLLYPEQLDPIISNPEKYNPVSFHVYIPIQSFIGNEPVDEKFILLIGHPYYLKGVDILIKAFLKISPQFPKHRLVVAGWCPDPAEKAYFKGLCQGNTKIDLLDPLKYEDVIDYMNRCSVYVSASRTEAMGRVLVEAMASRKPVVAPNLDGVPNIVKDGFNGLLFEKESVDDLAEKITLVLSDKELSDRLAENGYNYCQSDLAETLYTEKYNRLILAAVNG